MKKIFFLLVVILLPLMVSAETVEINGIYYNLISKAKQAEVNRKPSSGWYSGSIIIPKSFIYNDVTYSVTSIGDYAFNHGSGLTSIEIPNSVTSIGAHAFNGCTDLQKVIVPDIAAWCGIEFKDNYSNPLYLAHHLYSDENTEITDLVIPDGVMKIFAYAFYNCNSLTSITIPNSVMSIGTHAFYGCTDLQKVIVPDIAAWCGIIFGNGYSNPLSYAHHLYNKNNTESTALVIPNSVKSIGDYAFINSTSLTSVEIPNSVTSIGDGAFNNCSGLTSITISNSVTSIGEGAFNGCKGLTSITVPNSVTSMGAGVFSSCSSLTSVTISNRLNSIENDLFRGCSALTSIEIPYSVTSIGAAAFLFCNSLTSIEIPNSVTTIGEYNQEIKGKTNVEIIPVSA